MVAVLLLAFLAGCGAGTASLPYRSLGLDDSMAMTVEQYALNRLPAARHACAKPARGVTARVAAKACSKK
ncbi:MAG: hypothetical protein ABI431_07060 [Candidatus Tumulicola sp.]